MFLLPLPLSSSLFPLPLSLSSHPLPIPLPNVPSPLLTSLGVHEVERLSDKQTHYVHRSGAQIQQVCLYEVNDESVLYQEMLSYKASQASYFLISSRDFPDNDSDWEYLPGGDYYDGGSEFSASTPSYFSDHRGDLDSPGSTHMIISSQFNPDDPDSPLHIVGEFSPTRSEEVEVDFHTPKNYHFPTAIPVSHPEATAKASLNAGTTSSLTESAVHGTQRHLLHVSSLGAQGLSVSCEALPVSDSSQYEDDSDTHDGAGYLTPDTDTAKRFSFPRTRRYSPSHLTLFPNERYYDDDAIIVRRRKVSGNPEARRSWLNLTTLSTSTEVVEFSTPPSTLQRSNSLRLKGVRDSTLARTLPLSAVTHSQ